MQQAHITLYGHPKSIDLPVFGAKVIACYECTLDIHGAPQVSWTTLAETAMPGATSIKLMQPVEWPVGSKIAIATTDFESPHSSHTEVAQVESITESGTRVNLRDTRVCHEYSNSGLPKTCKHTSDGALTYPHLGEELVLGGRTVAFRAEVGLLSRNIVVEGDYDARLCPLADLADDGVTRLSCNQFGAQIFLSSPGHESLIGRMSNMEIRNGGQAFRLGRYAIHWHMIGNVKQSFQKNCSIHHSWNRGVAIHGVHFLLLRGNFAYHAMGHTFFIEDGVEHYNRLEGNLAIKTIPSMNLLNTDQTPACFWIVTGVNYVINNHAVASRRYGFWFRPERTVTGTSVNTPMKDHPINIPVLEFRGNQAHSNGKYGLRVFDIFKPNEASVFQDTFVWRNGKAGFTATVVGKVGFDGMIAVQNGHVVFEGRENYVESWDENYIRNALFVDWVPLPLAESFGIFEDNFQAVEALGGPMEEGILLPWNNQPGGGMSISNVTFVNFKNACIRGCAHCGRGGSPYFGDGAFETRFDQMTFINSSERVLFRHPNEAYFHDLDGSLTGTGIVESYTRGGTVRGASFVGTSPLLPPGACTPSAYSSHGTGGSVCEGHIFKRMWYHPKTPETWVGKALYPSSPTTSTATFTTFTFTTTTTTTCVRPTHQHRVQVDTCQTLQAECNCLPYLKKKWKGHVWLAAEGERYNVFQDLQTYELADIVSFSIQMWDVAPMDDSTLYELRQCRQVNHLDIVSFSMNMWDVAPMEDFQISHKFLEWEAADRFGRPMYWQDGGNFNGNQRYPVNYNFNASELAAGTYGTLKRNTAWASVDADAMAIYVMGNASAGDLAVPMPDTPNFEYAVVPDSDGYGAVHTLQIRGRSSGSNVHREGTFQIKPCKRNGCWPPPPAPPPPPPDNFFSLWSAESTWANLTGHAANPLNVLKEIPLGRRRFAYTVKEQQNWNSSVPSHYDNVWIPSWKKVLLDVSTPILGKIVVEGVLVINSTDTISLDAVYIELKGGTLIIAETDIEGNVVGPFQGSPPPSSVFWQYLCNCTVTLHGTNLLLSAIHGENPRETPGYVVGKEALLMDGGMLGVMGTFIAKGRPVGRSWANLANTSSAGATFVDVAATVAWEMGAEVVVTATDFGVHEAETRRILSTTPLTSGVTRLHLDAPLTFQHFSGEESHGTAGRSIEMRAKVGLLTRNVVIRGEGEGETLPYTQWNSAAGGAPAGAGDCGNGVCQNLENSKSCPADCVGPSYEYGAAILVAGYTEDFVYCSQEQNCESGYRRSFAGHVEMEDVEMRYHGQNNLRPSLRFANLPRKAAKSFVRNVAFNRGYSQVVEIDASSEVAVEWSVSFRSMLPSVRILPAARDAVVNNTLLISSIFWNTHRGAIQGKGLANAKINAMIGAVHVESASAKVLDVVVAGSERSGFSGKGVPCGDALRFQGNEVSASLAGYWYDQTLSPPLKCAAITNLTAWKIYEYGVYAETQGVEELQTMTGDDTRSQIVGLRSADARAGVLTILGGGNAIAHQFYMAWCDHLPLDHVGVYIGSSLSSSNMAPLVFSWSDGGAYAALYGSLAIEDSTFARFETSPCSSTAGVSRKLKTASDRAISSLPPSAGQADSSLSTTTRRLEVSAVPRDAIARMHHPSPSWINQADCIDMDCDGPKHNLIRDVDGTLIGGSGGTILPEAEHFSSKSFFGLPYKDGINFGGQPFWYPNVPAVMRSDMQGFPVNLSATSLRNGYGITREGCTFRDAWFNQNLNPNR
ncbi:hypothetical protein T484DRAFT_1827474 [Baffinella frigidus]|nr:hypothetical protein T484DRAFT_1827474 [Cryptophyta sp. CCMP2293]